MNDATKLLAICGAAAALALTGCGKEGGPSASGTTPRQSAGDGHDHDHDDHAHEAGDHDDGHEQWRDLGSVEVAGATLRVSISGEVAASAEVHFEIEHTAGPAPTAIRLWIGEESGVGSLKSKADGHDGHFHGHAETPSTIDENTAIWIEVEASSGERRAGSIPLGA